MSKKFRTRKGSPPTSVQAAVERLHAAIKAMDASRSRYAANEFLLEVYSIYWEWLDQTTGRQTDSTSKSATRDLLP